MQCSTLLLLYLRPGVIVFGRDLTCSGSSRSSASDVQGQEQLPACMSFKLKQQQEAATLQFACFFHIHRAAFEPHHWCLGMHV
jgi:hypothetical protein